MSTTTEELSPQVWGKLPIELVHQVLNHFVDDLLSHYNIEGNEIDNGKLPQLLDPWIKYRHMPLFSGQKRRIERHYRDHWLSRIIIYLYLDRRICYRFTSCPEGKDLATTLPQVEVTKGGDCDDDDAEPEEKVPFFLRGPMLLHGENVDESDESEGSGNVSEFLPRVKSAWGKVLEGKTDRLGLAIRHMHQPLEWESEDDLWSSESVVVLKGLEVLDDGRRVQFDWKELMSQFLPAFDFGVNGGFTCKYIPEPEVGSERE
ncbi:hypothetical protein QBC32DRAFT_33488 [Pseudoneurospora amorphoporcata]|uniref:Uncharacterized protein n=1 Tax=Pseudoneurospora amorphoporcata TaxID=241081 RepID=A0AAN6SDG4_9PEZI|nr:hypothetical protein QBC32DRAFT_33488 [Pseudoneurospora amorphoporcata]